METTLVLLACGKNDRGQLFPRSKRQLQGIAQPIRQFAGEFREGDCLAYHEATSQAEQTLEQIGFPAAANQGDRPFLAFLNSSGPDDFDLNKTFLLVQDAGVTIIALVLHQTYASKFAGYYLSRLGKPSAVTIGEGEAMVIKPDGTFHYLTAND